MADKTIKCPYCNKRIGADTEKCEHCNSMLLSPDYFGSTAHIETLTDAKVDSKALSKRYKIIKKIGQGGFGVVYLARDQELDMDVALKFLPDEFSTNREALKDLKTEAKLCMELTHPNIVRLFTLDTSGKSKFLVMEYIDGPNLKQVIENKGKIPLDKVLFMVKAIAEGLDYAHSKRILHRDLKPGNIMITSNRDIKIADFGIAGRMKDSMSELSQKVVCGTPLYMAPEHLMGEHLTVRSDIYSLGALTYELLCGHTPFYRGDIITQIRYRDPKPIQGLPSSVNTALLNALAKEFNLRPPSGLEFYKSLAVVHKKPGEKLRIQGDLHPTPPLKEPAHLVLPGGAPKKKIKVFKRKEEKKPDHDHVIPAWLTPIIPDESHHVSSDKKALLAKRKRLRRISYLLFMLILAVISGVIFYSHREINIHAEMAGLVQKADNILLHVSDTDTGSSAEAELNALYDELKAFKKRNPLSLKIMTDTEFAKRIRRLKQHIDSIVETRVKLAKHEKANNESLYFEARKLDRNGKSYEALIEYKKVNIQLLGAEEVECINNRISELEKVRSDVEVLVQNLKSYRQSGQWKLMFDKTKKFIDKYSDHPEADNLLLPLVIESVPSGAKVEIDGLKLRETPFVHYRKISKRIQCVTVSKSGYAKAPSKNATDFIWELNFVLEKKPEWVFAADGPIETCPVTDTEKAFVCSVTGTLYALDIISGKATWTFAPESPLSSFTCSPLLDNGILYMGCSDRCIYAINSIDGKEIWSQKLAGVILCTPALLSHNRMMCVACADGLVRAVDIETWSESWNYQPLGQITTSPACSKDNVFVGTANGQLFSLKSINGDYSWSTSDYDIYSTPVLYSNPDSGEVNLIFGSSDGHVCSLRTADSLKKNISRALWKSPVCKSKVSTPFVFDNYIYVTSEDGNLYCLDAAYGKKQWVFETDGKFSSSPVVSDDGTVYFGSSNEHFYAVSAKDGKKIWSYQTEGNVKGKACVSGQYVLVGSVDNKVYCFLRN